MDLAYPVTALERLEAELNPQLLERLARAHSPHTLRAWAQDSARFASYCRDRGKASLPASPATVATFLENTELAIASLRRILSTVRKLHALAGHPDPTADPQVQLVLQGLAREKGTRQRQARGLTWSILRPALTELDRRANQGHVRSARDAALASMAYETMARRGELVSIQVEDLDEANNAVLIRRSKTDPTGEGAWAFASDASFHRLRRWFEMGDIQDGAILRGVDNAGHISDAALSTEGVTRALRRVAELGGLTPLEAQRISGHSCRVGAAQDLVAGGFELPAIMQSGRWKSPAMVARYTEKMGAQKSAMAQLVAKR